MRTLFLALAAPLAFACGEQHAATEPPFGTHVEDWRDEVIYQIVVDRFDNGDPHNDAVGGVETRPGDLARHQGGDYAGILRRLDYLEQLGVTTLWLSPIVANVARREGQDGYHGYWASDFTRVNPRFGSLEELTLLVDEAHARGMKVIIDVVTNHAGNVFFYDLDGDGKLDPGENEPPYLGPEPYLGSVVWTSEPLQVWRGAGNALSSVTLDESAFHLRGQTVDWTDPSQVERGDFPTGLRDLATDRDDVLQALVDTYVEWVRLTDVDGFRLDAVPHVAHADWARFCTALRERVAALGKTRFFLLGEVFRGAPEELAAYTAKGELDAVFDFTFKFEAIDGFLLEGSAAARARYALEGARAFYPSSAQENGIALDPWRARVTFVDNHDVARIRGRLDDERAALVMLTLLFTADGIPTLYYGTEQGFTGGFGDGSREVLWESGFARDGLTFRTIARLTRLRRSHPALTRGELLVRFASEADGRSTAVDAGILAFERVHGQERVLVAINGHATQASSARVPTGFPGGTRLTDALGGARTFEVDGDGTVLLTLELRSALVLMPKQNR